MKNYFTLFIFLFAFTISGSGQVNTIKVKKEKFSFIGTWTGNDKEDSARIIFFADSTMEFWKKIIGSKKWTKEGASPIKWHVQNDSLNMVPDPKDFIEGQPVKDIFLRYKFLSNKEILFNFPLKPEGIIFRKQNGNAIKKK